MSWYSAIEESNCNHIKQLNIKVPIEVHKAAHLILLLDEQSYFMKKIINIPNRGRKIVTEIKGHSIILIVNKPS